MLSIKTKKRETCGQTDGRTPSARHLAGWLKRRAASLDVLEVLEKKSKLCGIV